MEFHKLLKSYRETINVSQKEVAERLNVTASALSRYENGSRRISVADIPAFKKAYALPDQLIMEALLGNSEKFRIQPEKTQELQEGYYQAYLADHQALLADPAFRVLINELTALPAEARQKMIRQFTAEITEQTKTDFPE